MCVLYNSGGERERERDKWAQQFCAQQTWRALAMSIRQQRLIRCMCVWRNIHTWNWINSKHVHSCSLLLPPNPYQHAHKKKLQWRETVEVRCSCLRLRAVSEFDEEAFKPSQTQSISLPLSEQFRCCCCYLAMASIRASLNIYIYRYIFIAKVARRLEEGERQKAAPIDGSSACRDMCVFCFSLPHSVGCQLVGWGCRFLPSPSQPNPLPFQYFLFSPSLRPPRSIQPTEERDKWDWISPIMTITTKRRRKRKEEIRVERSSAPWTPLLGLPKGGDSTRRSDGLRLYDWFVAFLISFHWKVYSRVSSA